MNWKVVLADSAAKQLRKAPQQDARRILAALAHMSENPYSGDIKFLKGQENTFRRRVGKWRILFQLDTELHNINVLAVVRRTTTTY